MMPMEETPADDAGAAEEAAVEEPTVNMKDVVETEFMKDLVDQLGLDIE